MSGFSLPKGSGKLRILSFKASIFSDESLSFLFAFLKLNAALTCRYRVFGEGGSPTRNICTKNTPVGHVQLSLRIFAYFGKCKKAEVFYGLNFFMGASPVSKKIELR